MFQDARVKIRRGSRACTACRAGKMKCVNSDSDICGRCRESGATCIFVTSKRGRKRKTDLNAPAHELAGSAGPVTPDLQVGQLFDSQPVDLQVGQLFDSQPVVLPAPSDHRVSSASSEPILAAVSHQSHQFGSAQGPFGPFTSHGGGIAGTSMALQAPFSDGATESPPATSSTSVPVAFVDRSSRFGALLGAPVAPGEYLDRHLSKVGGDRAQLSSLQEFAGPGEFAPQGVIQAASRKGRAVLPEGVAIDGVNGIASLDYFSTASPSHQGECAGQAPEILDHISNGRLAHLFAYYYQHVHHFFPVLSPKLHTLRTVAARSTLLLTTICALTLRFEAPDSPEANKVGQIAHALCFSVLSKGFKSVEIVQAYLLLSLSPIISQRRHETEQTWTLVNLAKCTAQDLGLDRVRPIPSNAYANDNESSEILRQNLVRTWLHIYLREQELCAQTGRSTGSSETPIIRSPELYLSIESSTDQTTLLSAEVGRIVAGAGAMINAITDSNDPGRADYKFVSRTVEAQLKEWKERFTRSEKDPDRTAASLQRARVNLTFQCARLCLHSHGLKHALDYKPLDVGYYFLYCYSAASAIVRCAKTEYGAERIRHAPDSLLVFLLYAGLSLLTYCRPRMQKLHDYGESIMSSVDSLVDLYDLAGAGRPAALPSQYGKLLRYIICVQEDVGTRTGLPSRAHSRAQSPTAQDGSAAMSGMPTTAGDGWNPSSTTGVSNPLDFSLLNPFLAMPMQGGYFGGETPMDNSFFPQENGSLPLLFDGLLGDMDTVFGSTSS